MQILPILTISETSIWRLESLKHSVGEFSCIIRQEGDSKKVSNAYKVIHGGCTQHVSSSIISIPSTITPLSNSCVHHLVLQSCFSPCWSPSCSQSLTSVPSQTSSTQVYPSASTLSGKWHLSSNSLRIPSSLTTSRLRLIGCQRTTYLRLLSCRGFRLMLLLENVEVSIERYCPGRYARDRMVPSSWLVFLKTVIVLAIRA